MGDVVIATLKRGILNPPEPLSEKEKEKELRLEIHLTQEQIWLIQGREMGFIKETIVERAKRIKRSMQRRGSRVKR